MTLPGFISQRRDRDQASSREIARVLAYHQRTERRHLCPQLVATAYSEREGLRQGRGPGLRRDEQCETLSSTTAGNGFEHASLSDGPRPCWATNAMRAALMRMLK